MKLILTLMLLPLGFFHYKATQIPGNWVYELNVYSPDNLAAQFDITISGYTLAADGSKVPMKLKRENLKTPYQLKLENGKYTATITGKIEGQIITSQIKGFRNGYDMGLKDGHYKKTILVFGLGENSKIIRGH